MQSKYQQLWKELEGKVLHVRVGEVMSGYKPEEVDVELEFLDEDVPITYATITVSHD